MDALLKDLCAMSRISTLLDDIAATDDDDIADMMRQAKPAIDHLMKLTIANLESTMD